MRWKNLYLKFRAPRSIISIKVCDWKIAPGEVVIVTGPSGVGKSTFLKTISGLVPRSEAARHLWPFHYSAAVCYEGDISLPLRRTLHNYTSYLPQDPLFFDGLSILDNIRLASRPQSNGSGLETQLSDLLRQLDVHHQIGTRVEMLSGGERQRVALARSLLDNTAALFCLDEPFSGVDSHNGRRAMALIYQQSLTLKRSFLIVSHNAHKLIPFASSVMQFRSNAGETKVSGLNILQQRKNNVEELFSTGEEIIFMFPEVAGGTEQLLSISCNDLEVNDGSSITSGLEARALNPGLGDVGLQTLFVPAQQITMNGKLAEVLPCSFAVPLEEILSMGTRVKLLDTRGRF